VVRHRKRFRHLGTSAYSGAVIPSSSKRPDVYRGLSCGPFGVTNCQHLGYCTNTPLEYSGIFTHNIWCQKWVLIHFMVEIDHLSLDWVPAIIRSVTVRTPGLFFVRHSDLRFKHLSILLTSRFAFDFEYIIL